MSIDQKQQRIKRLQKLLNELNYSIQQIGMARYGCNIRIVGANNRIKDLNDKIFELQNPPPWAPPPSAIKRAFNQAKALFYQFKVSQEQSRINFYNNKLQRLINKETRKELIKDSVQRSLELELSIP